MSPEPVKLSSKHLNILNKLELSLRHTTREGVTPAWQIIIVNCRVSVSECGNLNTNKYQVTSEPVDSLFRTIIVETNKSFAV